MRTLDENASKALRRDVATSTTGDATSASELKTIVLTSCGVAEDRMNRDERRVMHYRVGKGMKNNDVATKMNVPNYRTSDWYASGREEMKSALVDGRSEEEGLEVVKYLAATKGYDLGDYWLNMAKIVLELHEN